MENGDVLELDGRRRRRQRERVQAGMVYVDGLAIGDFRDVVLRDRHHLSTDGIVIVVVTVRTQDAALAAEPEVAVPRVRALGRPGRVGRGRPRARWWSRCTPTRCSRSPTLSILKAHVHDTLQRFLYRETRRRPMVMPVIVEV